MCRIKYIFVMIASFCSLNLSSAQELTPEQVYERVCNSVLLVYSYDENGYKMGQGSAVVMNQPGIIVTNFHIFTGGVKIGLEKNGEKIKDIKIIGADPEKDILILKIEDYRFPPIKSADSDSIKVGQLVYTLGNPLGYENTFSSGIITAIRNDINDDEGREFQFNASISHGSSGGALLNNKGELIGITSSSVDKGQNLNFAIPVNDCLAVNTVDYNDTLQVKAITSFSLAYTYFETNSYFRAQKMYQEYLTVFPYDVKALILLGKTFYTRSLYDSAITEHLEALSINPFNRQAYLYLGNAYSAKKDSMNSILCYTKAIELDSNYCDALLVRAFEYEYACKSYDSAVMDYTRALEIKPDYTFIYFYRGRALLAKGDTTNGVNDLYASINHDIDVASTCYERGRLFADLSYHQEAIDDFTQAIKLEPENDSYYFGRAIEFTKQSQHIKAIDDYKQVIMLDPYTSSAYNNLGYEYFHLKDYEQAVSSFKQSLEINKNEFDSYLGLSIVSFSKKEISDCKKYIDLASVIRKEIKKGMKGIKLLEKEGYFWSSDEKEILNEIFKLLGYNYNKKEPDKNHHSVKAVRSVKK